MKYNPRTYTAGVQIQLRILLTTLPLGCALKSTVMRVDVSLPSEFQQSSLSPDKQRWLAINALVKKNLIVRKTVRTQIQNRSHPVIIYCITKDGLEFLRNCLVDDYFWLNDVSIYAQLNRISLFDHNREGAYDQLYRTLLINDMENIFREFASYNLVEKYLTGTAEKVLFKNEALLDDNQTAREAEMPEANTTDSGKQLYTLAKLIKSVIFNNPLIESFENHIPPTNIFINSRVFARLLSSSEIASSAKIGFSSPLLGTYLTPNYSILCYHAYPYGMPWISGTVRNDKERIRNTFDYFGIETRTVSDGIMVVNSEAQFLELFRNKWGRKRNYVRGVPMIGDELATLFVIPSSREGVNHLTAILKSGINPRLIGTEITQTVANRHRSYLTFYRDDATLFNCTYNKNGNRLFIGSGFDAVRISMLNAVYVSGKRDISVYCERWQAAWYKHLWPEIEVLTQDDIPLEEDYDITSDFFCKKELAKDESES